MLSDVDECREQTGWEAYQVLHVRWAEVAELPQSIPERDKQARHHSGNPARGRTCVSRAPRPNQLQASRPDRVGRLGVISLCGEADQISLQDICPFVERGVEAREQGMQHGQAMAKLGSGVARLCALAVCEGVAG
jgi:hypothetical protein